MKLSEQIEIVLTARNAVGETIEMSKLIFLAAGQPSSAQSLLNWWSVSVTLHFPSRLLSIRTLWTSRNERMNQADNSASSTLVFSAFTFVRWLSTAYQLEGSARLSERNIHPAGKKRAKRALRPRLQSWYRHPKRFERRSWCWVFLENLRQEAKQMKLIKSPGSVFSPVSPPPHFDFSFFVWA